MSDILSQHFSPKSFLKFFEKDRSVLGIDIGTSSLKIVQARKDKERGVLETYGELAVSNYASGDLGRAAILADEKVTEMIRDLAKEAGVNAKRALVSVPLRYSFITTIEMPELADEELQNAVPFESRRYIPIPVSEVLLDWSRIPAIGEEGGDKKNRASILLIAVQREIIEKYKRIIESAGLEFVGYEIEVFSSARLAGAWMRQANMFIDMGAASTKISIVSGGVVGAVHNVDRGSQQLSMAISQSLGIDFKRAELMKHDLGMIQRPEAAGIRHTIIPLLDFVFDEANRLRSSYRRKSGVTVDKAILLGGGSLMPGFIDYAIEKLGIEVVLINPFGQFQYPVFLQAKLKNIAPIFSVAASLALRMLQQE
ncbi:MAG: type IV pilus assembly protein PilM [Candidatus Ryanbacteria bacterium]|nr:type IV pilus assembly protein PilM [Candidatus Ryanbacteria bacterium]